MCRAVKEELRLCYTTGFLMEEMEEHIPGAVRLKSSCGNLSKLVAESQSCLHKGKS
jgi:hypothetical protein